MKIFKLIILSLAISQTSAGQGILTDPCSESDYQTLSAPIQSIMTDMVKQGVPGISLAIYARGELKISTAGYAKIENKTLMQPCHLHYLGSIPKLYMATLIMHLVESDKINLDENIQEYLPDQLDDLVSGMSKLTTRMLLNHKSGLPEYNIQPAYISLLLQYPKRVFTPSEMLEFIRDKKPQFAPNERYLYTNSNYLLLSIMADEITGDHQQYLYEHIFKPNHLDDTHYVVKPNENYNNRLVNSYWDRFSDGVIENSSVLLNSNTASMAGDDGMAASPADAITFLKLLIEGHIVSEESLDIMQYWVLDKLGNPTYGAGFDLTEISGQKAYGHSGAGLGTGAQLYYFPNREIYMFIAVNLATVTESPIHSKVEPLLEELHRVILNEG